MNRNEQEQKEVIRLYSAFGASLLLMLVPSAAVAVFSALLFLGVFIAAYVMRKKSAPESLCENHATYIIRTIWIGGFLSVLTMSAATAYMLPNIDNAPLEPCAASLVSQAQDLAKNEDIAALSRLMQPCMDEFMHLNGRVFLITVAITAIPVMLYFLVRFWRGLSRANGGYRIANLKSWL
ncbi:MAG TPA: hypothetical protein DEA55_00110 [Rhodospirillaceae bacterium]|nr:hypothetical protein [Rhodospirillaceae bacterium]